MSRKILALATSALCLTQQTLFSNSAVNAEVLEQKSSPSRDDYFKMLTSTWDTVEDEIENFELKGKTDWVMPKWGEGIFVTSGPSKQEMNDMKFGHVFDGFGRFSNVNFKDGKAMFTSKMMQSDFYKRSMKNNRIAPSELFAETNPERWTSKIPGMNSAYFLQNQDNNWVQLEQLADNKTFVGTTDTYKKLEIDLESLETRELIKWQDDNYCMTGVSHSKRLPNGTVFSICSHFDIHRMALSLMVFRMDGDNTLKRKMIANIPQDRTSMQHAFAMTHEYAIIFDPPYYIDFDTYGMMFQNKQLLDLIENDLHGTTKIHVVRLSDGEVTTIDSKKWSLILHFSNAYQLDKDTLVVEGPAYEQPEFNPFGMFSTDNLKCPDNLSQKEQGSVVKKFIINLKDKTVTHEPMIASKWGGFDFPQYNPKWDGVAKHRYTYLFQLMHQADYDENYHWPIHKYDDEKKMIVATFGPPLTVGQEPRYVANPETTDEDDGFIISTFYNIQNKTSSIYVIDPKTMTAVQEYELPFRLSIQFHNNFFPHVEESTSKEFIQ